MQEELKCSNRLYWLIEEYNLNLRLRFDAGKVIKNLN